MIALDSKSEPFIAWKPGYMHSLQQGGSGLGPLVQKAAPPAADNEAYARQALTAAVAQATKEFGVLAYDVRRPSNVPEIKRARARVASLLLTHQNDDATGRMFTPAQVAKLLQFSDAERMVELVASVGLPA